MAYSLSGKKKPENPWEGATAKFPLKAGGPMRLFGREGGKRQTIAVRTTTCSLRLGRKNLWQGHAVRRNRPRRQGFPRWSENSL